MTNEKAIKWMEEAVQETTECFEQCSPTLQEELIKQKEVFELALTALRSMPEAGKKNFRVITQADNKDMDAPTNSVWISVKDQLPERFKPVLICREKTENHTSSKDIRMFANGGKYMAHAQNKSPTGCRCRNRQRRDER